MTQEHPRYDPHITDKHAPDPEHIGGILHRIAEQEGWNQHLPSRSANSHRPTDPQANGRRHG